MRLHFAAFACAALLLYSPTFLAQQNAPTPDRVTELGASSTRVQTNSVHPLATAKADTGRVASAQTFQRMVLVLGSSDPQKAALTQLLADQQDSKSPSYRKWITPAEFGERFGPSMHDVNAVVGWLTAQGFQVEAPANGRRFLLFTGTSQQVETAFQTEMHQYVVAGKTYMANSKPASVPSALAGVVKGIAALNSFEHAKPQLTLAKKPAALVGGGILVSPADLTAIYNAAPLKAANILGDGQSIAVIEESNINPLDFSDFRTLTGLPAGKLNVIVNGPDPGLLPGEESEAIIDASWAGAFAPNATINFVVSASTQFNAGIDLSMIYAVDFLVSPITSLSYGTCETLGNLFADGSSFYGALYEQGAAEGISHFVSSGDYGGDSCYRNYPDAGFGVNALGSSPYNVSVGGTEFVDPNVVTYFPAPTYVATGYIPERAWNDFPEFGFFFPLAGTGGVSINYSKPYWQSGPGVPNDGGRDVPDVSLLAGSHEAYLTCERDIGADCSQKFAAGFVGTSISSPNWAGIQALVNQKNAIVGGAGNPNPTYYRLAAGSNSPFHDITVGDNKIPDSNGTLVGYATTPGYDLATGLGSVDVNALVNAWNTPTGSGTAIVTLTAPTTHITHGGSLTASVAVTSTTSTIPTGDVALLAGQQGVVQLTLDNTGTSSYPFGGVAPSLELPGGSYKLSARYAGDANYASALSNALAITVDPEPSTTSLSSSQTVSIPYGYGVTLAAATVGNVSNAYAAAGGTYTFSEGSTILGKVPAPVTGESFSSYLPVQASLTLAGSTTLKAGSHSVTATFPGDLSFVTSTSAPVVITIAQGPTLTSLLASHTAPVLNTPVVFTANTQSYYGYHVPVTGAITFLDGNNPLGSVNLPNAYNAAGQLAVSFPYTFTTSGVHSVIASYSGDSNNAGGVSGIVNVNVGSKSSTTASIASNGLSLAGVATPLTATISGDTAGSTPTGVVTFTDTHVASGAGVVVGTATLTNGVAATTVTSLTPGFHNITATYPGDANYSGSVSTAAIIQTIDFTFTPATSSASVVAGQTTSAIALTYASPANYLTASSGITFACSGLPAGAACNFSTNPLLPGISNAAGQVSGMVSLTISTNGPTLTPASFALQTHAGHGRGLLAVAVFVLLGIPLASWRRRGLPALFCLLILSIAGTLSGCSGSSRYVGSGGTPAGPATVNVTASLNGGSQYGTLKHSAVVSLTVNSATGQ